MFDKKFKMEIFWVVILVYLDIPTHTSLNMRYNNNHRENMIEKTAISKKKRNLLDIKASISSRQNHTERRSNVDVRI
jgi:hemolysin activation/secretion protein